MKRIVPLLTGLLILQLGLALLLRTSVEVGPAAAAPSEPLLGFEPSQAVRIDIEGADGNTIALTKREGQWLLPDASDLPANEALAEGFLKRLASLRRRFPLASSTEAAERFRVVKGNFERRIVLDVGAEKPLTLYLGDAPEFRRTAVRVEGELSLYEAPLNVHEASVDANQWIDRELLYVDMKDLFSVRIESHNRSTTLRRLEKELWEAEIQIEGNPVVAHPPVDPVGAERLMRELTEIAYVRALGREDQPAYRQQTPTLRIVFTLRRAATTIDLTLSRPTEGSDYVLKSSAYPHYFEIAAAEFEGILSGSEKVLGKEAIEIPQTP